MPNIIVIGIAGGSGSGKTTLMKNLLAKFQEDVTVLSHDNYYRPFDEMTMEEKKHSAVSSSIRRTVPSLATATSRLQPSTIPVHSVASLYAPSIP